MKKIFTYLGIAALSAVLFSSCGLENKPAVFDDSFAFVAFDEATMNIDEDSKDTLLVPVTLASVSGLNETISYVVTDTLSKKGARGGVNFDLVDSTGTLSFDAENRTQYIAIVPHPDGAYTGDLTFTISLNASANVALGTLSLCTITINDIDHPLTPILGEYDLTGEDNWDGVSTWTLTIYKDAEDDHMVWLDNLYNNSGWAGAQVLRFYGNVNDEMTSIVIPLGQEAEYAYSNGKHLYLRGLTGEGYSVESGNLVATIGTNDDGKVTLDFGKELGVWVTIRDTGNIGIIWPGMFAVKK
ncbi:MAG: hypothetical protein J6X77_05120 [Bacteroidales bacterium]|nr:hypothetical protein [Bacteroidales bacterium]